MSQPPGASLPAAGLAAVDTVLLADVGNSRIKLAVMTEPATGGTLPLLAIYSLFPPHGPGEPLVSSGQPG